MHTKISSEMFAQGVEARARAELTQATAGDSAARRAPVTLGISTPPRDPPCSHPVASQGRPGFHLAKIITPRPSKGRVASSPSRSMNPSSQHGETKSSLQHQHTEKKPGHGEEHGLTHTKDPGQGQHHAVCACWAGTVHCVCSTHSSTRGPSRLAPATSWACSWDAFVARLILASPSLQARGCHLSSVWGRGRRGGHGRRARSPRLAGHSRRWAARGHGDRHPSSNELGSGAAHCC